MIIIFIFIIFIFIIHSAVRDLMVLEAAEAEVRIINDYYFIILFLFLLFLAPCAT